MGAEYDEKIFDADGLEAARTEIERTIEQCKYDYGHAGYTGTFAECTGTTFNATVFGSVDKARMYIDEKAEKWEDAILTRFRDDQAHVPPGTAQPVRWIVGGIFSS